MQMAQVRKVWILTSTNSGIGPADHLKSMDIPVIHPLEGVGANLVRRDIHSTSIIRLTRTQNHLKM